MNFSVTEKDTGMAAFKARVKELGLDPEVRVGVFADQRGGGEPRGDKLTNVEIAAIHEYGSADGRVPQRSFIRSTFKDHEAEYEKLTAKVLKGVVEGKIPLKTGLDLLGSKMVADVNKKVRTVGVPPPLSPVTIARKGSSRALIDTGRMLAAVTWVTRLKGGGE